MGVTFAQGQDLLRQLGVEISDLERLHRVPYEDAVKLLEALKERVRRNWKRLAFELHPDRTGGDPAKTQIFRDLTALRDRFEQMQAPRNPEPVQPTVIQVPHTPGVVYGSVRARPSTVRGSRARVGHIAANLKP